MGREQGIFVEVLDFLDGDEAGIKSVTIQVNGENAFGYLKSERRPVWCGFAVQSSGQETDVLCVLRRNAGY